MKRFAYSIIAGTEIVEDDGVPAAALYHAVGWTDAACPEYARRNAVWMFRDKYPDVTINRISVMEIPAANPKHAQVIL